MVELWFFLMFQSNRLTTHHSILFWLLISQFILNFCVKKKSDFTLDKLAKIPKILRILLEISIGKRWIFKAQFYIAVFCLFFFELTCFIPWKCGNEWKISEENPSWPMAQYRLSKSIVLILRINWPLEISSFCKLKLGARIPTPDATTSNSIDKDSRFISAPVDMINENMTTMPNVSTSTMSMATGVALIPANLPDLPNPNATPVTLFLSPIKESDSNSAHSTLQAGSPATNALADWRNSTYSVFKKIR